MYKTPGQREIADPCVRGGKGGGLTTVKLVKVRAVPKTYAGVTFRSTLEADWAATLDRGQIAWSYEPEAVQLPSGAYYRPDFWLPELDAWMEVKGPGVPGIEKPIELAVTQWVFVGMAPMRGHAHWDLYGPECSTTNIRALGLVLRMARAVGCMSGQAWELPVYPLPMSRAPR